MPVLKKYGEKQMPDTRAIGIPDDMKVTIAKVIALQSLATDPGQIISITAATMRWVKVGLVVKYGKWDKVPAIYQDKFEKSRLLWMDAIRLYGSGMEFWSNAMMPCSDIATDMAVIAGLENMMDYRQVDFNFTNAVFGLDAWQIEEKEAREKRAKEAVEG
jgi:hypothetical protein